MKEFWFDVETGGLDPKRDAILQIAGMIVVDGKVVEIFNYLLKPMEGKNVDPKALEINKIDPSCGQEPEAVYSQLLGLLDTYVSKYNKQDKFHIFGYNGNFDANFLRQFFADNGNEFFGSYFWSPVIDVMTYAGIKLMPERRNMLNFKLGTVCEHLGIELEGAHNALSDIYATRKIWTLLGETENE